MIYVHVPFCGSFCTYCDFYSELLCLPAAAEVYTDELCTEAERRKEEIRASQEVNTLYIGGGTPSVLPLSCLGRIAGQLRSYVDSDFEEFTVEVNPEDIVRKGTSYVRGLLDAGVNRVSMGVQSMDDGMLRWMNRRHDSSKALQAFDILRKAGVGNISLDLIFGISHMTDDMLLDTARRFIELRPEHISAYQLSIEDGSALAGLVSEGKYEEASDEQCSRQYGLLCRELEKAGYVHYEISNWARPGYEAVHNSAYWSRRPYVGLGPGAHSLTMPPFSKDGQQRSWNSQELSAWTASGEILSPEEIREEEIMLGLRTLKGWNGRQLSEDEWFISDSIISDILAQS